LRLKRIIVAAAVMAGTAVGAPASAWQAQPESNGVVGPAEIRGFSLPGQRPPPEREPEPTTTPATPPPEEPRGEPVTIPAPEAPATPAPAPAQPRTAPPEAEQARETPAPVRTRPEPTGEPEERTEGRERLPEPADVGAALRGSGPVEAPAPLPAEPLPAPETGEDAPVAAAEPDSDSSSWLWALLGALAVLGGAVAVLKRRRRVEEEYAPVEPVVEPVAEPMVEPLPAAEPEPEPVTMAAAAAEPQPEAEPEAAAAPDPVPTGHVGLVLRPWLELHFKPARATATEGGASVQYDAVIRNVGNAPARNVRLAARMFNAGPQLDQEVAAFFGMDIAPPDGAPLTILPRTEVSLSSVVNLPREEMREIKVQGRSLFIPTVAFNLLYEWGRDKLGQTCSSYVVGREPEPPAEKMAPFRLDLGPRVYRSVGQRPSALARAV
jgi:hypothetical protein